MQVVCKVVLALPGSAARFDDHPAVEAFRSGFNLAIQGSKKLLDIFGSDSKELFLLLSQRLPHDGAALEAADCIEWNSDKAVGKEYYVELWRERFYRYLKGVGHVQHENLREYITPQEVQKYSQDAGYRACRFLRYLTGQELIPSEKIEVTQSLSRISRFF